MSRYLYPLTLVVAAALLSVGGIIGCSDAPNNPVDPSNRDAASALQKRTRVRTKAPTPGTDTAKSGAAAAPTPAAGGCVHSMQYWATHPLEWPAPFVPDAQFCTVTGAPYFYFIQPPTGGDCTHPPWAMILAQQYIAALLNKSYNGGKIPKGVQDAINEAQLFFNGRDMQAALTPEEIVVMARLYNIFNEFNYGIGGGPNGSLPKCAE